MAETITQVTQPPEFIESESKLYLDQLRKAIGGLQGADLSKIMGPQFVAGQDPLQLQAQQAALAGIGGYQPYLQSAAASAGPTGYQQFMSPYQQEVIGTTLAEYDIQAQKGAQGIPAAAIAAGAFGGGREGVQRAEYQSASDRNRAALQAQLLQQGFGQAQGLAQQNIANQLQLGQAQQGFLGQDVGALSTLGGINQAQNQAQLQAQQQLGQAQLQQPLGQLHKQYGSGIMGLISGYPGGTQQTIQPTPGALQTILGAGSTLAGIYKAFNPTPVNYNFGQRPS
jgi:hypothetical protein